jgi:hypothetical protein
MEKAGKAGDWHALAARFPELRKEFQSAKEAMREISKCVEAQQGPFPTYRDAPLGSTQK